MIRWICSVSLEDRRTLEELRTLLGVEPITTVIRSGMLKWYGHVMKKNDEDWVEKCMEIKVEGRKPVGTPRKTCLENVETYMSELATSLTVKMEIVYNEEEVQPYRESEYKRMIYKLHLIQC